MIRIAAALLVLLLVAACQQTVVRQETRFIPPTDPEKIACIERCDRADLDCLDGPDPEPVPLSVEESVEAQEKAALIREEYDRCSKQVEAQYSQCQMKSRSNKARGTCYKPVCLVKGKLPSWSDSGELVRGTPDAVACARIYRACYQRCGGRVETIETCEGPC